MSEKLTKGWLLRESFRIQTSTVRYQNFRLQVRNRGGGQATSYNAW